MNGPFFWLCKSWVEQKANKFILRMRLLYFHFSQYRGLPNCLAFHNQQWNIIMSAQRLGQHGLHWWAKYARCQKRSKPKCCSIRLPSASSSPSFFHLYHQFLLLLLLRSFKKKLIANEFKLELWLRLNAWPFSHQHVIVCAKQQQSLWGCNN